jgi:transposase
VRRTARSSKTPLHALVEMMVARPRTSEKTHEVVSPETEPTEPAPEAPSQPEKRAGHGRNGGDAFEGARRVSIAHQDLKHGDSCPECGKGKVYGQKEPKVLVRIVGQAPIAATRYDLERLRCNACGQIFTAKYGSGMPFKRMEQLERHLGIPLPAATQWEIVEEAAEVIRPAHEELIRQAAQGGVFHNDDTGVRILKMERPDGDERTGTFTSGVVSIAQKASGEELQIALYFSGRNHAGENLAEVLKRRAADLGPAILMSDALSRNVPKVGAGVELLLANCLTHGRRNFVEVVGNFPAECRWVLETLGQVYANDAVTKEQKMTPAERLEFHREHSQPLMESLQEWMGRQFSERKVEPNSGLGKAITYMDRHWKALTLFLRQPGAPLDNNVCERILKRAILHRKNALFYRTQNGAQVGDLFLSLIQTCDLNGVNSFDYLVELLRHAKELAARPAAWMPWNYRGTLTRAGPPAN